MDQNIDNLHFLPDDVEPDFKEWGILLECELLEGEGDLEECMHV